MSPRTELQWWVTELEEHPCRALCSAFLALGGGCIGLSCQGATDSSEVGVLGFMWTRTENNPNTFL